MVGVLWNGIAEREEDHEQYGQHCHDADHDRHPIVREADEPHCEKRPGDGADRKVYAGCVEDAVGFVGAEVGEHGRHGQLDHTHCHAVDGEPDADANGRADERGKQKAEEHADVREQQHGLAPKTVGGFSCEYGADEIADECHHDDGAHCRVVERVLNADLADCTLNHGYIETEKHQHRERIRDDALLFCHANPPILKFRLIISRAHEQVKRCPQHKNERW